MDESQNLSTRLRALRVQRGMSLRLLAERAGVSAPTVLSWERNQHNPTSDHIDALAKALGVSTAYLVSGADRDVFWEAADKAARQARQMIAECTGLATDEIEVKITLGKG